MQGSYITRNGITIPSYAYPLIKDYVNQYEKAGGKNFTVKFKDQTIVETLKLLRAQQNNRHKNFFWDEYEDWEYFEWGFCYDKNLPHPDTYNIAQDYDVQKVIKCIWEHVKEGFQIIEKPQLNNSMLNNTQKYALVLLWFIVLSPTLKMVFFGLHSENLITSLVTLVAGVLCTIFLIFFSLMVSGNSLKNFIKAFRYKIWGLNRIPLQTKIKHPEILAYLLQENPMQGKKLDR